MEFNGGLEEHGVLCKETRTEVNKVCDNMKVSFVTLKDCSINKPIKLKIDELKQHFSAKGLFEGIGCSKTTVAKLKIKENVEWNIQKYRPVPLAIKPAVELKINRLIDEDIIERTEDENLHAR